MIEDAPRSFLPLICASLATRLQRAQWCLAGQDTRDAWVEIFLKLMLAGTLVGLDHLCTSNKTGKRSRRQAMLHCIHFQIFCASLQGHCSGHALKISLQESLINNMYDARLLRCVRDCVDKRARCRVNPSTYAALKYAALKCTFSASSEKRYLLRFFAFIRYRADCKGMTDPDDARSCELSCKSLRFRRHTRLNHGTFGGPSS